MKVGWRTSCEESSPYFNLSGTETFEDGDEVSNITVSLPDLPQSTGTDHFSVVLSPVKSENCKLGPIIERNVEVTNDIGNDLNT